MASLTAVLPARVRRGNPAFLLAALATPLVLLVARLLPAEGPGLALRLAAAGACVLVLPGAVVLRAIAWPASRAVAACGAVCVSLGVGFLAFAVAFAVNGTLVLVLALVGVAGLAACIPAARAARPEAIPRGDRRALLGVLAASVAFAGLVWWASDTIRMGDALFHLARARKLAEADVLSSVEVANEFRDGGLHPGYAFPLWHGELAMVARLAGVDVADVALHLGAVLVPVAFVAAYAAGGALFGSWAGGVAALAAQVAQLGFSRGGTGSFVALASPATVTRLILVPAFLALAFAYLRTGTRRELLAIAAGSLAIAVIHPTYLVFIGLALLGFAALRIALSGRRRLEARSLGLALAATVVPAGLFFLWLLPTIADTASINPSASAESNTVAHYGDDLEVVGDAYRASPGAITRSSPVIVAAFLVVPLVALFARRRWGAFVTGGTLLLLTILVLPEIFTRFSDLVSISQSRRLAHFLPVPFAVAAACVLAGRLRLAGVALALAAGIALELAYGGAPQAGPGWPVWVALAGGAAGLVAGSVVRRLRATVPSITAWAAAVGVAFAAPFGVAGLSGVEPSDDADRFALTPGLVAALRGLDRTDVVYAPVETAYRVAAYAPVYIAASPAPHVANTDANRPFRRQRDAIRFFSIRSVSDDERRATLRRYGADWLLVDKERRYPREFVVGVEPVYEDERYLLVPVTEP